MAVRNRKQATVQETDRETVEEVVEESAEESVDYNSSHYDFTALRRRPLLLRLDVGPFVLAYLGLILLDTTVPTSEYVVFGSVSILSVLFVTFLLVQIGVVISTQWSVEFRADIGYHIVSNDHQGMEYCLVKSQDSSGIVKVELTTSGTWTINYQDRIFRYTKSQEDLDEALWKVVPAAASSKPSTFRPVKYPINLPCQFYRAWRGHETLESCKSAHAVYGLNSTLLQLPSFLELLGSQLLAPFFLFQIFCVILWSLDEYWYYAIFTLFALLMFESTVAYNRQKSLQRLQSISHKNIAQRIFVRRNRTWMSILVRELLPGDYVSLSGNNLPVPADILLLSGSAVCDEALLTGESVPQLKQPLDTTGVGQCLDMTDAQHKESILFGGTVLLVGTPQSDPIFDTPDGGVTGIVLRTGFETAQGNLLRTMAHTSKTSDGVHTMDTFVFILLLVICAIAAAAFVLNEGWHDERRNRFRLVLHVIIIITSVVPPELPMELSLAVTNSVSALMHRCQVYCTEHFRIPWAGEVTVCCFDKTGTLTSDSMLLKGVRLFHDNDESKIEDDEDALLVFPSDGDFPRSSLRIMAACHSLAVATLGERRKRLQVIGDPLEQEVLKHTGYYLSGINMVASNDESQNAISILHRFAFSSKLKCMTVLVSEQGAKGKLWALTKGAPETIKELLTVDSLPHDYDDVAFRHMSRGRRVLAMAYRDVGFTKNLDTLKNSGRDAVECNLTFAGFIVLDCPLKAESKLVITELKRSGHRVVMITGDAVLTAAEVARQVGIVKKEKSGKHLVYRIRKRSSGGVSNDPLSHFECFPLRSREKNAAKLDLSSKSVRDIQKLAMDGKASFCIDGVTLVQLAMEANRGSFASSKVDEKHLLLNPASQAVLTILVPLVSVFARHSPHQKEAVVAAFNRGGSQTLMCGDGTNDVGALKRAHVGISIISAPEVESKQREAVENISKAKSGKTKKKKKASSIEESLRQLREAQRELDQVELGDASVAAPFTSRAVSIKCCKDIIQQGRCTLVTMLQIYKILGINCLVNALVLSKLFLHGAKQGDRQLTILGIVVAALFYFVTRAEPLSELSPIRPPASVLCMQALVSITGQFMIHMASILLATDAALTFVDPYDPSLVPDGPFNPNVLNTVTFMLMCLSTINTFAVNYRGQPFMKGLKENKLFYRSLQVCYAVLVICSLEVFPPLNDLLQLTTLPSTQEATGSHFVFKMIPVDFPLFVTGLMALNTVLSFSFERTVLWAFEQ